MVPYKGLWHWEFELLFKTTILPPPRQVDYRPTLKNILLDYWNLLGFYLPPFLGCGWQGFHCKGLSKTPSQLGEGSGRGRK